MTKLNTDDYDVIEATAAEIRAWFDSEDAASEFITRLEGALDEAQGAVFGKKDAIQFIIIEVRS